MALRKTQLTVYEHKISCPHCKIAITFNSLYATIELATKTCPKCDREFVIERGKAKKLGKKR